MKKETIYFSSVLIITAVIFAVLTFWTPLIHDDFAFLFKYGEKADVRPTDVRVKNVADVLESQYYFYQTVNGRFFTHFLLQLVLMLGKNFFNILNVLVFTSLILLLVKYHINSLSGFTCTFLLLFVIFSFWFFAPFFGQTMLWAAGALNYLWASTFVVLFLLLFKASTQNNHGSSWLKLFLFFIFSFISGNTNEAITFGVAATLFFWVVFNFRKQTVVSLIMILGFGLGVSAIVFSPGTISRANNDIFTYSSSSELIRQKITELVGIFYLLKLPLASGLILLIFLKLKKAPVLKICLRERIIILSVAFNCFFLLAIGGLEMRMLFGVTVLLILFNTVLLVESLKFVPDLTLLVLSMLISCFLAVGFYNAFIQVNGYRHKNLIFTNQLKNKNQKTFYFPNFRDSRFVYHTLGGVSDSKNYHNRVRSFYYGLSEVNIVPESIYHQINYLNMKKANNWSGVGLKKILWLKNDDFAIIKISHIYYYNESISAKIVFTNGEEKFSSVSVIPITDGNYAFFKTDSQNLANMLSVTLINQSGKIVQKIEKSENQKVH